MFHWWCCLLKLKPWYSSSTEAFMSMCEAGVMVNVINTFPIWWTHVLLVPSCRSYYQARLRYLTPDCVTYEVLDYKCCVHLCMFLHGSWHPSRWAVVFPFEGCTVLNAVHGPFLNQARKCLFSQIGRSIDGLHVPPTQAALIQELKLFSSVRCFL